MRIRTETWLALLVAGVGLLIAAILGLFAYMSVTATPLHPDPRRVRSVTDADPSQKWADSVERGRQIMRAGVAEQNLPGLSVAVGIGGDIVWAEGFGWADLEYEVPVAPDTRFRIGTASTVLTSAAVGVLLEKGLLKLDDEIQTYVPEFPKKQWPVTLRQLMAHLAGVRNDGGDEGPLLSVRCERPVDGLQHFAPRTLLFEPGTEYRYSSYGWILVSAAVEAAADEPFLTFMRRRIFEPLGMDDTRADSTTEPIPHRATFYFPRFAADPAYGLHLMRTIDYSCYAGSSAFLSTPSDLVRFGMAIDSGKLLQPATVQLLQTSQRLRSGEETGYGLGWDLETVTLGARQTHVAGHDGEALGGMVASLITFRERGIVVAVTSNISYADTFSLAVSIAQAFADRGTVVQFRSRRFPGRELETRMAKKVRQRVKRRTRGTTPPRRPLTVDQAMVAVLIAAMDANEHVSRAEAWRAHHIIWSMRRFRNQPGEKVDRLIDAVRTRMEKDGPVAVLREAARTLPARARRSAFAVAVDLMLADARLERAETQFIRKLAEALEVEAELADDLVRALVIKNSA